MANWKAWLKEVALLRAMLDNVISWGYLDVNPPRTVKSSGHEATSHPGHRHQERKTPDDPINEPLLEALRLLPRHLEKDYVFWSHETKTRLVRATQMLLGYADSRMTMR